jgi:molybdopterin-synthase adenylyltransferase
MGNKMIETRFSRQSFLGEASQNIFERAAIGIVGLGGGGSHIVQQLAHIGFLNYINYDPDIIKQHNLNRLVGATEDDVIKRRPKTEIAKRVITGLQSRAMIQSYDCRWQENPEPLRHRDIVFGCIDGFRERQELESMARTSALIKNDPLLLS